MTAAVENDALVLKHRPDGMIALSPTYADAFTAGQLGTVIIRRDPAAAAPTGLQRRAGPRLGHALSASNSGRQSSGVSHL